MSGFKSWASVIEESAYATDPGGARDGYIRLISETMSSDESITDLPGLGIRDVRDTFAGHRVVGGTIQPYIGYEGGWLYLFKHAMGGYAFTANDPGSGSYKHEFSTDDDLPTGLSIEINRGDTPADTVFLYEGCKVDQLAFSWESGSILDATATIIAADETENTAEVSDPTYPDDLPIKFNYFGTLTVAGSTLSIKSGTMTIANSLERRFLMSRNTVEPLPNALRQITGTFVAELTDLTHYTKYKDETTGALSILWDSSPYYITGTYPYKLSMIATDIKLTAMTPNVSGPGVIEMPINYKIEGSDQLIATLWNGMSATL